MSQNQAILAASILASQGSLAKLQTFLQNYNIYDKLTLLSILLVFTPELEPASNLLFVKEITDNNNSSLENQDAVIELLSDDPHLIDLLEVNSDILSNRINQLKSYLAENCTSLGFVKLNLSSFVKARIRKTFAVNPDIHFNDPLFRLVADDTDFQIWSDTIVGPYEYLKRISTTDVSLLEFENLSQVEKLKLLLDALEIGLVTKVELPIVAFVENSSPNTLIEYLQTYPPENVRTLQLLNKLIVQVTPAYEPKDPLIQQTTATLYEYPELSSHALQSISEVLGVFQKYSNDSFLGNLIKLTSAAKAINFDQGSLKALDEISKSSKSQEALLHSVLENIDANTSKEFINQLYVLRQTIFTNINFNIFNSLLIEKLLSLRLFSLVSYQDSYEDLMIDYFWKCFKRASNGSKHRGEILNASQSLRVIPNPSPKVKSLQKLIDSIDELSHYSLYFKPGTPLVPADFLAVGSITEIIQRVLELNPEAYLESDKLLEVSNGLTEGLSLDPMDTFQLKAFCIESALANNDFEFALDAANELLDTTKDQLKLQSTWLTFFQVGKYVSPEWLDTEIPKESIKSQLDLLAKVLKICPVKNTQVIIAQWSSLDMELSLR